MTIAPQLREHLSHFDVSSSDPVDVIVTLSAEPAGVTAAKAKERGGSASVARDAQLNQIRTERGNVFSQLRRNGIAVTPKHEFELAINGFALTIPANQLPLLAAIPGVTGIYEDLVMEREDDSESVVKNIQPELSTSVPAVQAPALWSVGLRGEGVLVAIIDDGVEYTHPDLGGCIRGAGCKVVDGYDFVDLDDDPRNGFTTNATTGVKTRDYHGSHVAATAAGLKGVAPDATILAIRVLGTNTTGKPSNLGTVMSGIEYALRKGAHVANMSIGLQNAWGPSTNLWSAMTGNAMRSGMVWVNSNGNDGPTTYRAGMYAASPDVIAVGNADARPFDYPRTKVVATNESLTGGAYGTPFPASLLGQPLQVVDVGFGNSPSYYNGKNVAGKIAIAMRGGLTGEDANFTNKADQAKAHGAVAVIIYNDAARSVDFTTAALSIPSFTLSYPNGLKVIANPTIVVENFSAGAQMASGSSRGPTPDLLIKPDVSAPGTGIVAAVPFDYSSTGYAALNGTSMAAPHVAGAAALLRQAHPEWTTQQIKLALMNTAGNLRDLVGNSFGPIEQGSGMINIARALAPNVVLTPASISFGQLMPANGYSATRTIDVASNGATYQVSTELLRNYAGVTVNPSSSFVSSGNVTVTATIAAGAASGEYQGFVNFVNVADATDAYRVPFLFVHSVPVSEVAFSKYFAQSSNALAPNERITVTFNAGRPLANWFLGTAGGTQLSAVQPATAAGAKTMQWNVRNAAGAQLAEGNWQIGIWYKLAATDAYTFSANAYVRIFVDKTAPAIALEGDLPALTNNGTVTVRGAIADSGMFTWGEAGGKVVVNGQPADLFPRAPTVVFQGTGWNSELAFDKVVTLAEGANTITIHAEDAAGNRSSQTFTLSTSLDSIAPVTSATHTPAPNAAGWNNTAASLQLASIDGGSGVLDVRYSIDGGAAVITPGAAATATFANDGQYSVSYFATDKAGNAETARTASVWVDTTAPVLAFSGNVEYALDELVTLRCTATDNLSGVVGTPCADALLAKMAWELPLGTTTVPVTIADAAGNGTSATATVRVVSTFDSLSRLTASFTSVGNSMLAQLATAKDAAARGNTAAANGALRAYQNEVAAQTGKALTAAQAAVLQRASQALIR
ncbi:MAG TPA: S8 family serine peptidase [Thermoanaerobaculia bacterium]